MLGYFSAISSDVSCNNGSNGSVWIDSVSGGTAPYIYSWINSVGSCCSNMILSVSGLSAGTAYSKRYGL